MEIGIAINQTLFQEESILYKNQDSPDKQWEHDTGG